MAHYKGGQAGGNGVGGWRGWAGRGGLNLLLGQFGLAISPRSASHGPKHV